MWIEVKKKLFSPRQTRINEKEISLSIKYFSYIFINAMPIGMGRGEVKKSSATVKEESFARCAACFSENKKQNQLFAFLSLRFGLCIDMRWFKYALISTQRIINAEARWRCFFPFNELESKSSVRLTVCS